MTSESTHVKTFSEFENAVENIGGTIDVDDNITFDRVIYVKVEGTIINGNGHTIDAGEKNRIFCFQAKNIVLKNMRLINADPEIIRTWSGGAVHWESGADNCQIINCTFENDCVSLGYGGAIWCAANNGRVINCTFNNCIAERLNGYYGGTGGAIYVDSSANNFYVVNSSFNSNYAIEYAGAIDWRGDNGKLINSTFTNNHVKLNVRESEDGFSVGAVSFRGFFGLISKCNFTGNKASFTAGALSVRNAATVKYCNFNNNKAAVSGGAITVYDNAVIKMCNFTNNGLSGRQSGGKTITGGAISFSGGPHTLGDCTFIGNYASDNGGAVAFSDEGDNSDVRNCRFINNTCNSKGGAVYFENTGCAVYSSSFEGNNAQVGGALYAKDTFTVNNCLFVKNSAKERGGAIWINYDKSVVGHSNFINNTAVWEGGAIYWDGAYGTLEYSNFVNNSVTNNGDYGKGGAVYWNRHDGKISNSNFESNKASKMGGAVYLYARYVTVSSSVFKYNEAVNDGGAICRKYYSWDTIENDEFIQNSAKNGAAIWWDDEDGTINNCVFRANQDTQGSTTVIINKAETKEENNVYDPSVPYNSNGGAIFINDYKLKVSNCKFLGNLELTINIDDSIYGEPILISIKSHFISGSVNVIIDGEIFSVAIDDNGEATCTLPYRLNAGIYSANVKYLGNYINSTSFKVYKANSTVSIYVDDPVGYSDDAIFIVTVPNHATGEVTISVDNFTKNGNIENGQAIVNITGLKLGEYTAYVKYDGDGNYLNSSNSTNFRVITKHNSTVSVSVEDIVYGENATVIVTVPDDATRTVTISVGNYKKDVNIINGKAMANLTNWISGSYEVYVTYNGDEKYLRSYNSTEFRVNKANSSVVVSVDDIVYGDAATVVMTVLHDARGNVTLKINDKEYVCKIVKDKATINVSGLVAGDYTAFVTYNGDNNYFSSSNVTNFKVNKKLPSINVNIENIVYGENATVNVTVHSDATGNVTIVIGDFKQNGTLVDGRSVLNVSDLKVGNYIAYVIYNGDSNYLSNSNKTNFTVFNVKSTVNVTVKNCYVGDKLVITAYVPSDATGYVLFILKGVKYNVKISNGVAILKKSGLAAGNYKVSVKYSGDDKYSPSTNTTSFKISKIATKLTIKYKKYYSKVKSKKLTATLKDQFGKAIKNKYIVFKVNGKTYKAKTNSKGIATVKVNLKKVKTYAVNVKFAGDKKYLKSAAKSKVRIAFKTVKYGSKDHATVKQIQRALKHNKFYLYEGTYYLMIDGIYHKYTVKAVKQFQKAKGLKITGEVDEKTAKKLKII